MPEVLPNPQSDSSLNHFSYLDGIVYPNKPEVEEFIKNHQESVPLIQYGCNVAKNVFGESAQLAVEVDYDPESADIILILTARQEHYSEDFNDILDKIERIRRVCRNSGLVDSDALHIMTDGQPPLEL